MRVKTKEHGAVSLETVPEKSLKARKVGGFALHLAKLFAAGATVAAPYAAFNAIEHTSVHDEIGPVPGILNFSPGYSMVDGGPFGGLASENLTKFGLGATVTIKGVGVPEDGSTKFLNTIEPIARDPEATADGYTSALTNELRENFLENEAESAAFLAGLLLISERLYFKRKLSHPELLAASLALFAVSGGAAVHEERRWVSEHQLDTSYPVANSAMSSFGQLYASTSTLQAGTENFLPGIDLVKERNKEANQAFLDTAKASIDAALENGDFIPPEKNQTMILMLSDMHSNDDMIQVYRYFVRHVNEKYGEGTIKISASAGDETYGSALEKSAVDNAAKIAETNVAILGNHDSKLTLAQEKAAKFIILRGSIKNVDGLRFLGDDDPKLTSLASLFGMGNDTLRTQSDVSKTLYSQIADIFTDENGDQKNLNAAEIATGEQLAKLANQQHPTFLISHEATGLAPLLKGFDKNSSGYVSQDEADAFFNGLSNNNDSSEVSAVPFSVAEYGHWHRVPKVAYIKKDTGGYALIIESGTSGGASAKSSLSNFSLPFTVPAQTAYGELVTINNLSELPLSVQQLKTERSGNLTVEKILSVPQSDAALKQSAAEAISRYREQQKTTSSEN